MTPDVLVEQPTSVTEIRDIWARYRTAFGDASVSQQSVDGRYVDAYSAGFLLAKTVVRASGYRVRGGENHRDTIAVVPWLLGSGIQETVDILEAARRKRNQDLYDGVGFVDEEDVRALLECVDAFEQRVLEWLGERHPDLVGT
jgi:hypothetical protein